MIGIGDIFNITWSVVASTPAFGAVTIVLLGILLHRSRR